MRKECRTSKTVILTPRACGTRSQEITNHGPGVGHE